MDKFTALSLIVSLCLLQGFVLTYQVQKLKRFRQLREVKSNDIN